MKCLFGLGLVIMPVQVWRFVRTSRSEVVDVVEKPSGWIQAIPKVHILLFFSLTILAIVTEIGNIIVEGQFATGLRLSGIAVYLVGVGTALWGSHSLGVERTIDVRVRREHSLISSGAYSVIRHPMYFGAICLWWGTAIAFLNWYLLVAAATITPLFWLRAKVEENLLAKYLGDDYLLYQANVPMLFPRWNRSKGAVEAIHTNNNSAGEKDRRLDFRRKAMRLDLSSSITSQFSFSGDSSVSSDKTQLVNISRKGFSLKSKKPISKDETIIIQTPFSDSPLEGRVVWCKDLGRIDPEGFQFKVGISTTTKIAIGTFLSRYGLNEVKTGERRRLIPLFSEAESFAERLSHWKRNSIYVYFRVRNKEAGVINFGSNDFLDLGRHPEVVSAAKTSLENHGIGVAAASILTGTRPIHKSLEAAIAEFKGCEDAIVTTSGYVANLGSLKCLANNETIVLIDEKSHASMFHGCEGARVVRTFRHNDISDLADKMARYPVESRMMILTEGVFSMDGDKGHLSDIRKLADHFHAYLFVDDGHGFGLYGEGGRGVDEEKGILGSCDIVTGSLSKAVGSSGGFVAGKKKLMEYLRHFSIPLMFTTAPSAFQCAAAITALEIIRREPDRRASLHANARHLRDELAGAGFNISSCNSHLVPVVLGDELETYRVTSELEKLGIIVSPVSRPAVRRNEARVRLAVRSGHTRADIARVVKALKDIKAAVPAAGK